MASSASKQARGSALILLVEDGLFFKGPIFDQGVLLTVTYDCINNQVLLSSAFVTFKTEDHWVWFSCKLEHDFPKTSVIIVNYSKGIENQQFQGDDRNS